MTSVDELIREFAPTAEGDAIETTHIAAIRAALDQEIAKEAGRRGRHRRPAWRITKPLRLIPLVAACLVVVVVAGVALTVVGDRSPRGSSSTGPAAGPAADALISRLAVLRRPQTAADRLPRGLAVNQGRNGIAPRQLGVIVPSLTRLVARRPDTKLYLVVTTPARGPQALWTPSQGDQVAIVDITPRGATQSVGYPAAELSDSSALIRAGLLIAGGSAKARATASGQAYGVSIVPDGVSRVRWTFLDSGRGPGHVVTAQVVNNVAITPSNQAGAILRKAIRYAPDGSVVPTSANALNQAIAAQQAADRRQAVAQAEQQHVTVPARLLDAFAVFSFNSPTGTRTPNGYLIAHPPLTKLPLGVLTGFLRYPLDFRQARSVRAPSGLEMWIVPGQDGLCVFHISPPITAPDGRVVGVGGVGGGCSGSLQSAIANGAGVVSGYGKSAVTYSVVPRAVPGVKIQRSR